MAEPLVERNVSRDALRDLLLVLADSKRLLGTRYAGWMLGAPELEGGIALASMAQDEWGHGRLLYALLRDFDEDVTHIEHGRDPTEYRNIETLDEAPEDWAALVAINILVDTAMTVQLEALRASSHAAARQRIEKMLDEEQFHSAHGAAWARWFARTGEDGRRALRDAVEKRVDGVLRWFGPDSEHARMLVDEQVVDAAGSALRSRFAERVRPLLEGIGGADLLHREPAFSDFDEHTRRTPGASPDAETIRRVRGDRNRAFLMD